MCSSVQTPWQALLVDSLSIRYPLWEGASLARSNDAQVLHTGVSLTAHQTSRSAPLSEVILLLLTAVLPLLAIGTVIYVAVRLAIRHEHPHHPDH